MQAAIYTIHAYDPAKLATVIEQMQTLGSPTIRACLQGDHYCALEGVHRIEAARRLGLPVRIVEMDEDDVLTDHDIYDLADEATVAEVLEYASWMTGGDILDIEVAG